MFITVLYEEYIYILHWNLKNFKYFKKESSKTNVIVVIFVNP